MLTEATIDGAASHCWIGLHSMAQLSHTDCSKVAPKAGVARGHEWTHILLHRRRTSHSRSNSSTSVVLSLRSATERVMSHPIAGHRMYVFPRVAAAAPRPLSALALVRAATGSFTSEAMACTDRTCAAHATHRLWPHFRLYSSVRVRSL